MKRFKFFAMLFMALMTCATFSACSDDDDDEGGGKTSSSSLKGRTFQSEYTGVDGDGNPESRSTTLYFKSTTECSVTSKGYWYI